MSLREKILKMADEIAKELEAIPCEIKNMSRISHCSGKLEALNELMKFMLENNI
jgi:hypothetical protein